LSDFAFAERIAEQKVAVKVLVTLYSHSSDVHGSTDELRAGENIRQPVDEAKKFFKKALKGVKAAATHTTTALGNVASEIAGR
jgi:hypothetical protein